MIQPRKDKRETNLQEVAEGLSTQSELRDPEFWKEYFYWSWRCLLCVLFIVVTTNFDYREGLVDSLDHISPAKWAVLVIVPLLIGPAFVVGWSYLWTWGRDLLSRARR